MAPQKCRGFLIRSFLPDGTPDGLKHVEKFNWSGLGVVCPRVRSLFAEKKVEKEFGRTGVYVFTDLSGCSLDSPKQRALLTTTLGGFGVRAEGDQLLVRATPRTAPQKMHDLIQAIL
jgi:Domain of unknown function DUF1828.